MKLRSSRIIEVKDKTKEEIDIKEETIYSNKIQRNEPEASFEQSLESIFPPSPHNKKRIQTNADRFIIPSRERNLAKNLTLNGKRDEQREMKRITAYFRAEVLDDPNAADEYIQQQQRRTLQPVSSSSSIPFASSSSSVSSIIHNQPAPSSLSSLSVDIESVNIFESPNASRFQTSPISEAGRRILLSSDNKRHFNTTPIKILDAPDLQDDFYLNLMDWGNNDCLAVGLGSSVYLWNANTSKVTQLCDLSTESVTSVKWSTIGNLLAIGTSKARTILYDTAASERVRTWTTHTSRVGSLAWASNILSTGGRDHYIYHHDVRSNEAYFRRLTGHTQEICGLKWNPEGNSLASGGNDNNVMIWDSHENIILHRFSQHTAAIKALDWSPHKRGLLVTGGGTADKTMKVWNTISGNLLSSHDTGSQVCNLVWSKRTDDIISSHGFANQLTTESNLIHIWKADKMEKVGTLSGHKSRVLYMSMSHDGSTIVTGAADETLMFWDLFLNEPYVRNDPEERLTCLR